MRRGRTSRPVQCRCNLAGVPKGRHLPEDEPAGREAPARRRHGLRAIRLGLLANALRWRAGSSVVFLVVALLAVAAATAGPVYLAAADQSVLVHVVVPPPPDATGLLVSPQPGLYVSYGAAQPRPQGAARARRPAGPFSGGPSSPRSQAPRSSPMGPSPPRWPTSSRARNFATTSCSHGGVPDGSGRGCAQHAVRLLPRDSGSGR